REAGLLLSPRPDGSSGRSCCAACKEKSCWRIRRSKTRQPRHTQSSVARNQQQDSLQELKERPSSPSQSHPCLTHFSKRRRVLLLYASSENENIFSIARKTCPLRLSPGKAIRAHKVQARYQEHLP